MANSNAGCITAAGCMWRNKTNKSIIIILLYYQYLHPYIYIYANFHTKKSLPIPYLNNQSINHRLQAIVQKLYCKAYFVYSFSRCKFKVNITLGSVGRREGAVGSSIQLFSGKLLKKNIIILICLNNICFNCFLRIIHMYTYNNFSSNTVLTLA